MLLLTLASIWFEGINHIHTVYGFEYVTIVTRYDEFSNYFLYIYVTIVTRYDGGFKAYRIIWLPIFSSPARENYVS